MHDTILNFGKQFNFQPEIINKEKIGQFKKIVVLGMGGSHLAGNVLSLINPVLDLKIHSDYGLPNGDLSNFLIIASSYSGNTEETIDGLKLALENGLTSAVVATGGRLLEIAKENNLPYIQMPNTGIQPRSALGFSLVSLAYLIGDEKTKSEIEKVKGKIDGSRLEEAGKALAERLKEKIPLVYTSTNNHAIAYNWKIKFNETGKIPAFCNVLPELNHNEMTGFDVTEKSSELSKNFHVIFLNDKDDDVRIQKRVNITSKLYKAKGVSVEEIEIVGNSSIEKVFNSLLLADWAAYYNAKENGAEPEQVPMVEEFKKLIK